MHSCLTQSLRLLQCPACCSTLFFEHPSSGRRGICGSGCFACNNLEVHFTVLFLLVFRDLSISSLASWAQVTDIQQRNDCSYNVLLTPHFSCPSTICVPNCIKLRHQFRQIHLSHRPTHGTKQKRGRVKIDMQKRRYFEAGQISFNNIDTQRSAS